MAKQRKAISKEMETQFGKFATQVRKDGTVPASMNMGVCTGKSGGFLGIRSTDATFAGFNPLAFNAKYSGIGWSAEVKVHALIDGAFGIPVSFKEPSTGTGGRTANVDGAKRVLAHIRGLTDAQVAKLAGDGLTGLFASLRKIAKGSETSEPAKS